MKDEISIIMLYLYENVQDGEEWDATVSELQRLMCYREVRALIEWADPSGTVISEFQHEIITQLVKDYPESMILEAIEKVKKDQK